MQMILSADQNWGIGHNNALLVSIPADMKRFREKTMGKVVVMGRKTLESLPGGAALEGRRNIVLTSDMNYKVKNAIFVHNLEELMEELKKYPQEDIFIIGGASLYEQMLPYCKTAHVTKIDFAFQADAYAPNLDQMQEWKLMDESDEQTYFNLEYCWMTYERTGENE